MTTHKGRVSSKKKDVAELPGPFVEALDDIYKRISVATEPLAKVGEVRGKPLHQILDEMDENIRAAAEAARKAELAARAVKQAAMEATRASEQAEKRAEDARQAGIMAAQTATQAVADAVFKTEESSRAAILASEEAVRKAGEANEHFTLIEKRVAALEATLPEQKIIILREISKEDATQEIRQLFSEGQILYYSDIAEKLGLDLQMVVEICNELQSRGEIEIVDNALQSR